jgi:hypothetical protein
MVNGENYGGKDDIMKCTRKPSEISISKDLSLAAM